jgi:hypothetical protein
MSEPEFVKVKEPKNRLQGIDSGTTSRVIVTARQATYRRAESIPGLLEHLQIRALGSVFLTFCLQYIIISHMHLMQTAYILVIYKEKLCGPYCTALYVRVGSLSGIFSPDRDDF